MPLATDPLLGPSELAALRQALGGYTVETVAEALGLVGQAAHARGDLAGVGGALRRGDVDPTLRTLIRMFLLGDEVDESAARSVFGAVPLDVAERAGLLHVSAGSARAGLEIRPYAEMEPDPLSFPDADRGGTQPPWWVVSDLGSDVRPGPLAQDHVLGIGMASLTLAQATPRPPGVRALDIGTGCGVQSLHLAAHSTTVTATDVSERALRMAATTAALSGQDWDLRLGSLLEPVAEERYDLVVANPPFVVSAGGGDGYDYRDSGLAGDGICERLLTGLPTILAPGGTAVMLANWIIPRSGEWQDRLTGWLAGRGCDAWIWRRETADPGEYVSLWLRDAGEVPGSDRWTRRYDAWTEWMEHTGVAAVGLGLIALRRHHDLSPGHLAEADLEKGGGFAGASQRTEIVVVEDVPQPVAQPIGDEIHAWFGRRRWTHDTPDRTLLAASLRAAPDLVRSRDALRDETGWRVVRDVVRQTHGLRWEIEVDEDVAALLAGSDGQTPLGLQLSVLAASTGLSVADVTAAALPVVRDLLGRGVLLPPEPARGGPR